MQGVTGAGPPLPTSGPLGTAPGGLVTTKAEFDSSNNNIVVFSALIVTKPPGAVPRELPPWPPAPGTRCSALSAGLPPAPTPAATVPCLAACASETYAWSLSQPELFVGTDAPVVGLPLVAVSLSPMSDAA